MNWSLREPMPWRAKAARAAGTLHVGVTMDELAQWSTALGTGLPSEHLFALVGQPAVADRTRAAGGGESLWAYSHLPRGRPAAADADTLAERLEALLEGHAPGFRDLVVHRFVQRPGDLEAADAALVTGAVNGGTAQLHQQLVFRPLPGLGGRRLRSSGCTWPGRPATPAAACTVRQAGRPRWRPCTGPGSAEPRGGC